MSDEPKTPYGEGYAAAAIPPSQGQPDCPYTEDDPRYDKWWEGFGDWADDKEFADQWDAENG